jgi:hypothetical protein
MSIAARITQIRLAARTVALRDGEVTIAALQRQGFTAAEIEAHADDWRAYLRRELPALVDA